MNNQLKNTIKNIGFAVFANALNIFVSALLTLMVPKVFSEQQYGFWQLYVFYSSYIGLFNFGLQDGIYLRYGGTDYTRLDKPVMHSQMVFLMGMELIVAGFLFSYAFFFEFDISRRFVLIALAISVLIYLPNTHLQYVLQAANRIKHYSFVLVIEKIVCGILVILMLLCQIKKFETIICADLAAKFIGLLYVCWQCKDIVFSNNTGLKEMFHEAWKNMSAGFKLLVSNLAAQLCLGVLRIILEQDITLFAKVSMAFSLCNFVLIFASAIGQVVFPALKQLETAKFTEVFLKSNRLFTMPLLAIYLLYAPASVVLQLWLPHYTDALFYFMLLMPMCVFESKNTIIMSTFFKANRMEKELLFLNVAFLCMNSISAAIMVYLIQNLEGAIIMVTVLSGLKRFVSEVVLTKRMKCKLESGFLWEVILSCVFIVASIKMNVLFAFIIYLIVYCLSVFYYRNNIITHSN